MNSKIYCHFQKFIGIKKRGINIHPPGFIFNITKRRYSYIVLAIISLVGTYQISLLSLPASAQLPSSLEFPSLLYSPPKSEFSASTGISGNDSGSIGNLDYTTVQFDGYPLFLIAVPGTLNSSKKTNDSIPPVEHRQKTIESKLQEIIQRGFDPDTIAVNSSILNGLTVIQINDEKNLRPLILRTITQADADLYAQSVEALAETTSQTVKAALLKAREERQPLAVKRQIRIAASITAILIAISLILSIFHRWLGHRISIIKMALGCILKAEVTRSDPSDESIDIHIFDEIHKKMVVAPWIIRFCDQFILTVAYCFLACKKRLLGNKKESRELQLSQPFITAFNTQSIATEIVKFFDDIKSFNSFLRQRLNQIVFSRRLLIFIAVLIWIRGFALILQVFPTTRWHGQKLSGTPISLILIWFSVLLLVKILDSLINVFFQTLKEDYIILNIDYHSRQNLRVNTINSALRGINIVLCVFGGLVASLSLFDIPVTTILAGAGILGFAISFGSQSIVKDLIAGISNLINDSFAVDDFVKIGEFSGTVEDLNLFVTRIRCSNGDLVTIPNGTISTVCNQTKDWSRVDFSIMVAVDSDLDKAIAILNQVALGLYHDPLWHQKMLAVPDFKGVDDISHQGILLRLWLKTLPGEQWDVGRELRLRVKGAFEAEHIAIGIPQQKWLMEVAPALGESDYSVQPKVTE